MICSIESFFTALKTVHELATWVTIFDGNIGKCLSKFFDHPVAEFAIDACGSTHISYVSLATSPCTRFQNPSPLPKHKTSNSIRGLVFVSVYVVISLNFDEIRKCEYPTRKFITHNRSSSTIADQDALVWLTTVSVTSGSCICTSLLE